MKKVIRFDSGTTVQNCRYLDSYDPPTAMRQPWQTQSWGTDYIWAGLYKTVGRAIRFLNGRFRMPYAFLCCRSCRWMLRSFWKRTVPQLLCLLPRAVYIHIQTFRRVFILIPWLTVRTIMHRKAVRYSLAGRMCSKASNWNWSAMMRWFPFYLWMPVVTLKNAENEVQAGRVDNNSIFYSLPNGSYPYTVEKFGYVTQRGTITVSGEEISRTVSLEVSPQFTLRFYCIRKTQLLLLYTRRQGCR